MRIRMRSLSLQLLVIIIIMSSTACSVNSRIDPTDTQLALANLAGLAGCDNYSRGKSSRVEPAMEKLLVAENLLESGSAYSTIKAAVLGSTDSRDAAYAQAALDLIEPNIKDQDIIIDPQSQAGRLITAAIDGCKKGLLANVVNM